LFECEIEVPNARGAAVTWAEWATSFMMDHAGDIMTGEKSMPMILTKLMDKYKEITQNDEEDLDVAEESDEDDVDYGAEIRAAERTEAVLEAQKSGKPIPESDMYSDSFT
jgi:hypothetical protein